MCPIDLKKGVTLAVYAAFGADPVLSRFPDGVPVGPLAHPLGRHLLEVARLGVRVSALIDLYDDATYQVDIPPGRPQDAQVASLGKLDTASPVTLATLLRHAHAQAPEASLVLTTEGHGAGFLPDIDRGQVTLDNATDHGKFAWQLGATDKVPLTSRPSLPDGSPLIESGAPVLPVTNPTMPGNASVLSTWGVGAALAKSAGDGAGRPAVIHFNNCFNMSTELLHTVFPYAEAATGYCNYNFFTAGEAYPAVFARLVKQGSAAPLELAGWFAEENHRVLAANGHEPTIGCTVELARMRGIAERVDALADALLPVLQTTTGAEREGYLGRMTAAITRAQQYDTRPDYVLEVPDELTDLDSLATELKAEDFGRFSMSVHAAADALRASLAGIKQYGDKGTPWMAPGEVWDFSSKNLAMNIFLPDPMRRGLWDWRAQFYLDVNPDPNKPQVQKHLIDFVKVTDWVDFLVEYHRDTPFNGLLPAAIPSFPVKSLRGDPPRCTGERPHEHHAHRTPRFRRRG